MSVVVRRVILGGVALVVAVAAGVAGAGTVSAAPPRVVLGGGAGIVIPLNARTGEVCTLASIGRDRTGALVGLTAGHCGDAGRRVYAERAFAAGPLGVIVTSVHPRVSTRSGGLDYAVIRFDPARMTPTPTYRGVGIRGVGGAPRAGSVACKSGRSTGYDCGVVFGPDSASSFLVQTCSNPGDSGAPVLAGGRLIGVLRGDVAYTNIGGTGLRFDVKCSTPPNPIHNPTVATLATSITADLAARNLPGAGYHPL